MLVLGFVLAGQALGKTADLRSLSISNVFLIVFENHDWSDIKDSPECPFLNQKLLPRASFATKCFTPTNNHPSLPNYLWLVGGTNYGILDDRSPLINTRETTNHLAWLLDQFGVSWRSYAESVPTGRLPLTNQYPYAPRHIPFLYFRNINTNLAYVTNHIRPLDELGRDLAENATARFSFITPNLTNDMHDAVGSLGRRRLGDNWLARYAPLILGSRAWREGGLLLITWDEGSLKSADGDESDGPIGLMALSPAAKGRAYQNSIVYDHGSTLRTIEEIFHLEPLLGNAANATDLADFFVTAPVLQPPVAIDGRLQFTITATTPGHGHRLEAATALDVPDWQPLGNETAAGASLKFYVAIPATRTFYRVVVEP